MVESDKQCIESSAISCLGQTCRTRFKVPNQVFSRTAILEIFHGLHNKWIPKSQHFSHLGQETS